MSGADFYSLCSDALMRAYQDKISSLNESILSWNGSNYSEEPLNVNTYLYKFPEEKEVFVSMHHFELALSRIRPSLTQSELERYRNLRDRIENKSK
jgi:peroxin-6